MFVDSLCSCSRLNFQGCLLLLDESTKLAKKHRACQKDTHHLGWTSLACICCLQYVSITSFVRIHSFAWLTKPTTTFPFCNQNSVTMFKLFYIILINWLYSFLYIFSHRDFLWVNENNMWKARNLISLTVGYDWSTHIISPVVA